MPEGVWDIGGFGVDVIEGKVFDGSLVGHVGAFHLQGGNELAAKISTGGDHILSTI
jgi:hypothetical protein